MFQSWGGSDRSRAGIPSPIEVIRSRRGSAFDRPDEDEDFIWTTEGPEPAPPTPVEDARPGRNWFERVFAPFEAPQQALYSLTRDIAEDGFQFRDLWNAASHGVHYFNPWSDAERISEEEINEIFFGEGSKLSEGWSGAATNIGIALLYDPLLVGGLVAKGARALGAGASTIRNIERISNPASLVMEGVAAGAREAAPAVSDVARRVMGDRRYDSLSRQANIWFRAPSQNLPQTEYERLQQVVVGVQENRVQGAALLRKASQLNDDGIRMLGTALEDRTVRESVYRGMDTPRHQRRMESLVEELDAKGVDKDLFFEVVDDFSSVTARHEDLLISTGRLSPAEAAEEMDRHLRRAYNVRQSPVDALRRLDRLQKAAKDEPEKFGSLLREAEVFDRVKLRESLMEMADELSNVRSQRTVFRGDGSNVPVGQVFQYENVGVPLSGRYFRRNEQGVRQFNVDNFLDDLGVYIRDNPEHSVADALEFINKQMLGGTTAPEGFNTVLADYLANGMVTRAPLSTWVEKLETLQTTNGTAFRRWGERQRALQERIQLPDEIADALWRYESPLVRMVEQIEVGGREALMSSLFDDVAGAIRMPQETIEAVKNLLNAGAYRAGRSLGVGESVAGSIAKTSEYRSSRLEAVNLLREEFPHLDADAARRMVDRIDSGNLSAGTIVGHGDDALGSLPSVDPQVRKARGHTVRLPESEAYGAAAGMYVDPYMAHQLQQAARVNAKLGIMTDGTEAVGSALSEALRGLVSHFKFFKIVADPSAHFRDTVGSLASMDIMGVNAFRPKIWQEAMQMTRRHLRGEADDLKELAHSVGYDIFGSSMSAAELSGTAAMRAQETTREALDWIDDTRNFWTELGDFFSGARNKASALYQNRESTMRAYVFTSRYRDLEEAARKAGTEITRELQQNMARQAAEMTNKVMFNYADVPMIVDVFRSYGVAPFLTFPTKAAGQFADALYTRPWSVLKYDRTMTAWNENWAGGDEEFAKEIQALPEHMRRNLVVRLPWENKEGNPLYLDLSYFLPWSAVRDLATDAMGPIHAARSVLDTGVADDGGAVSPEAAGAFRGSPTGGGIFSPPIAQLYTAFAHNRDGLGREIYNEHDTGQEKAMALGRYLWQFVAPPLAPGGVTSDSVGRSILAAARTSAEPVNWVEHLGLGIRLGNQENVLNRYGEAPTARALPSLTENPAGQAALGLAGMFFPVSESNAPRQSRNASMQERAAANELAAEVRRISQNPNLTPEERTRRIARLRQEFQELSAELSAYRAFIGY